MVGSDNRTRTSAATPGREGKTSDRRRVQTDSKIGRTLHSCTAHRWVEERRANRKAQPAARLPAFVTF
ncbi:hypothetical protein H0I76_00975 [Limibaculum sp. M0105]|uniref:Uncharacterized protein n=1 Tax=Thermohalobaculum xanthum TaxID=2753746 RepID=A0A8J7M3Q1_9RHOB|nr:hypothetical protein [Thermohalobaculum xanthum]MBK0397751.1 hypothetical protein [Thermohalobaculum xanthum]